jgi:hypothetical protein
VRGEVVVTGLRFGEGPVLCADGTVVATSVCDGFRAPNDLVCDTAGTACPTPLTVSWDRTRAPGRGLCPN